jgi:excisionase family DNA binding protein
MEPIAVPIPEAARITGCSRSKIYEEVKAKRLTLVKVGRKSLLKVADLRDWINSKATT